MGPYTKKHFPFISLWDDDGWIVKDGDGNIIAAAQTRTAIDAILDFYRHPDAKAKPRKARPRTRTSHPKERAG